MDGKENDKINKFDSVYSNNSINKLKIIYSYFSDSSKRTLALYIKLSELQLCLSHNSIGPLPLTANEISLTETEATPSDSSQAFNSSIFHKLCSELMPYCNSSEKNRLQQILDFLEAFENLQEMSETIQLMRELMPQTEEDSENNTSPFGNIDISQLLNVINMISPD